LKVFFNQSRPLGESQVKLSDDVMLSAIQHVTRGNTGVFYTKEPEDEHILERLEFEMQFGHHNRAAGCGVPLVQEYKSLGECIDSEPGYIKLAKLAMDLLRALRDTPHEEVRKMTYKQLVESGLAILVQIMIKQEPHSQSKFAEERYRVISRVPAQVIMVERVLYGKLVDVNLAKWDEQSAKPGMGLDDASNEKLWRYVEARRVHKPAESNDVAAWDGSCPTVVHEANTQVLVNVTHAWGLWENMIRNLEYLCQHAVFVLSNGEMYVLTLSGDGKLTVTTLQGDVVDVAILNVPEVCKQLSGRFLTAFNNSNMRGITNYVATPLALHEEVFGAYMGDDAIVDSCTKDYTKLGLVVTDRRAAASGQPFDFCSHLYVGGPVAIPSNWGRTLYKLMSKPYSEAFFGQFLDEMRWLQPVEGSCVTIADVVALLSWSGWLPPAPVDDSNKNLVFGEVGFVFKQASFLHDDSST